MSRMINCIEYADSTSEYTFTPQKHYYNGLADSLENGSIFRNKYKEIRCIEINSIVDNYNYYNVSGFKSLYKISRGS